MTAAEGGLPRAVGSLSNRVEILEKKVEALELLPARVDALAQDVATFRVEFLQFGDETRLAFSAIQGQIDGPHGEVHGLRGEGGELRAEMHQLFENAMSQSRAMFGETLRRIALLAEHQPPRRRKR